MCAYGVWVLVILVKSEWYEIKEKFFPSFPPLRPSAVPSGSIAHAKMSGSSFWGTVVKPGKTGTPLRTKASQLTMVLKQV